MSFHHNPRALITGANRGIGLEWTRQLAGPTDRLFATCRQPGEATQLQELAAARPDTIEILSLDVAAPNDIRAASEQVRARTDRLELLINNADINSGGRTGSRVSIRRR